VRPSKIIHNVSFTSPELSIRVVSIPANFVLPAPGVFLSDARHEFIFTSCFGLELAAVSGIELHLAAPHIPRAKS